VLRELGCHWLDQLLVFAAGACKSTMLRKFYHAGGATEAGFLATLEFEDGTSAALEVQTASLLSLRTGWLLEGSHGAYRAGRRYSKAADGEIIDEPVTVPETSRDPFLDHLVKVMAGDPSVCGALVPLSHAARTMSLIEQLEAASEPAA
jgi:predicted dehydrogenase